MEAPLYQQRVEYHANMIARRVDPVCGVPIVIAVEVLCVVLNMLINCWRAMHYRRFQNRDPEEMRQALKLWHQQDPNNLRFRTANRISLSYPGSIPRSQSLALADAAIAEAIDDNCSEEVNLMLTAAPVIDVPMEDDE